VFEIVKREKHKIIKKIDYYFFSFYKDFFFIFKKKNKNINLNVFEKNELLSIWNYDGKKNLIFNHYEYILY